MLLSVGLRLEPALLEKNSDNLMKRSGDGLLKVCAEGLPTQHCFHDMMHHFHVDFFLCNLCLTICIARSRFRYGFLQPFGRNIRRMRWRSEGNFFFYMHVYAMLNEMTQAAWAGAPRAPVPLNQAIATAGRSIGSSAITFAAIAGTYKAVSTLTEGARGRSVRFTS